MNPYHRTGVVAITATAALAIFATSAGAWDDLPCGSTEATAHKCAPGEKARDGSTPVPAPVVVTPPPAPTPEVSPTPTPTLGPVVVTPPPPPPVLTCARLPKGAGPIWRRKAHCAAPPPPVITCADLNARKAGLLWFAKFGCTIPARFRNVGPFVAVPVAG